MNLVDKVALITGGTRGIGAAAAIELARRGADVAIVGRHDDDAAGETKSQVESLGRRCLVVVGEMGKPADATGVVQRTADQLGSVDVLVHCAGGAVTGGLLTVDPETWRAAFDVHVHALYLDHRVPLHREGTPEQVASLIAEVVANDYLTGETFTIDGGLTMRIA